MLRDQRWLAFLVLLHISTIVDVQAAQPLPKRTYTASTESAVVIDESANGYAVSIKVPQAHLLPPPAMRYIPGAIGQAVMTLDFPWSATSMPSGSYDFKHAAIHRLDIGAPTGTTGVVRLAFVAAGKRDFSSLDIRTTPGAILFKFPNKGVTTAPPVAPPLAADRPRSSAPPVAAERPVFPSPPIAAELPAPPPVAPERGASSTPKLRGPIYLGAPADATYTRQKSEETGSTSPAKPASVKDKEASVPSPEGHKLKTALKKLFGVPVAPNGKAESSVAAQPESGNQLLPVSVNVTDGPDSIQLQISSKAPAKTFRLHSPERFVVDLYGAAQELAVPEIKNFDLIKAIRTGSPDGEPQVLRLVVDLTSNQVVVNETSDTRASMLTLTFSQPERKARIAKFTGNPGIILDAGHGGTDPGAQRGDVQEKEITLAIVQKLKKALESKGVRVKLTRADDTFVSLEDRVRITNDSKPDAFVSVHINSLETNATTTGIETYYQNDASKDLAQLIHTSLVKGLEAPDRNVRKARFYVINHTPFPAVLAEVGFISNKQERDKLITSDYQAQIAEALADGVMTFLGSAPSNLADAGAPNSSASGMKSGLSGTNSALPASQAGESFTQNLQMPPVAPDRTESSKRAAGRGFLANQTQGKQNSNSASNR